MRRPVLPVVSYFQMRTIDLHTHGIAGYDTQTTRVEEILKIAALHGAHGVSEIVLSVYPSAIHTMRGHMLTVTKAMDVQQAMGSRKGVARIIGIHLEGPFLNPVQCGALKKRFLRNPAEDIYRRLTEGFEEVVRIITIAPEMPGALQLIKKISLKDVIVNMGHSDATFAEAEAGFRAGARGITHVFNAMRGMHHREPGIAGFGLLNRDVYIEVIADAYHLHPETLGLIFRAKDHKRILIVSDTVKGANTSLRPEKAISDAKGRLLGGSMTVTESAGRLIRIGYARQMVLRCITENPRRYLNAK